MAVSPAESRTTTLKMVTRVLYTFAEADHLAGASPGTTRRWLSGYEYKRNGERVLRPPVTQRPESTEGVSFLDLLEVVVIRQFKDLGFSLAEVRRVVTTCQKLLKIDRPLTSLPFKTGGREIFVDRGEELLEVGRRKGMQAWNDILWPFLEDLDYLHDIARRWWPLGKSKPILVDPEYGFGLPVVRDSGVRTEILLERFQAGDLEDQIAHDFNISGVDVQRALQFELSRAA